MASAAPAPDLTLKIVMAGESGVGKTNLISRYTRNEFLEASASTIGVEFATRTIKIPNPLDRRQWLRIKLQIWDTAGQERYRAVSRTYYRGAVGCVLVYSATSKRSLKHLDHWLEEVRRNGNQDPLVLLAGNKSDVDVPKVKPEEGEAYCKANDLACYFPVSAKTGSNVDKAFEELVVKVLTAKKSLVEDVMKKRADAVEAKHSSSSSSSSDKKASGGTVQLSRENGVPDKDKGSSKSKCC